MRDPGSLSRRGHPVWSSLSASPFLPQRPVLHFPPTVLLKGRHWARFLPLLSPLHYSKSSPPSPLSPPSLIQSLSSQSGLSCSAPNSLGDSGRMRTQVNLTYPQGHAGGGWGRGRLLEGLWLICSSLENPDFLLKGKKAESRASGMPQLPYMLPYKIRIRQATLESNWSQRKSHVPSTPHARPPSHPRTPS